MLSGEFISVQEAATIIGCTDSNVRRMIAAGDIEAVLLHPRAYAVRLDSAQEAAKRPQTVGRPRSKTSSPHKNSKEATQKTRTHHKS